MTISTIFYTFLAVLILFSVAAVIVPPLFRKLREEKALSNLRFLADVLELKYIPEETLKYPHVTGQIFDRGFALRFYFSSKKKSYDIFMDLVVDGRFPLEAELEKMRGKNKRADNSTESLVALPPLADFMNLTTCTYPSTFWEFVEALDVMQDPGWTAAFDAIMIYHHGCTFRKRYQFKDTGINVIMPRIEKICAFASEFENVSRKVKKLTQKKEALPNEALEPTERMITESNESNSTPQTA